MTKKSSLWDKELLVLHPSGSFERMWDYMGGDQECQLPFSFYSDADTPFGAPEIKSEKSGKNLTFCSKNAKITISLEYDSENRILLRRDSVTNLRKKPLTLRRYLARFPLSRGEYEICSRQSFWCREDQSAWESLRAGSLTLKSREGRFCETSTPFAVLRDTYSSHAIGFMVFPEGDWMLRFSAASKHGMICDMTVEAGLSDDRLELVIPPGESWEAPPVAVQQLPDRDPASGAAPMNRFLNALFPPRKNHQPVVYNTWLDRMGKLELPRLRKQLEAAKECGCEVFVVDYGWYNDNGAFTRLNNWDEHLDRAFYGKMKDFADEVRKAGLGFGFWVEFEFFSTESDVVKEHPDWFFPSAHPNIVSPKIWLPEVEDHLVNTLADTIRRYKAVYIKNDMNHSQGYDPSRLSLYYKALERVMARLQKMLPQVTFENCSSGSSRMAAGSMLRNFDLHFISDNGSPLENLRMIQEMGCRFPVGRIYHWYVGCELHPGSESSFRENTVMQVQHATWYRSQCEDLHFGLLTCITGMLGFSCDLASFSDENRRIIRRYSEFFKANREKILKGVLHCLTPHEDFEKKRGWLAFELSDPASDTHFLYVFHNTCDGDPKRVFHPQGLKEEQSYQFKEVFPEEGKKSSPLTGAELARRGIVTEFTYDQLEGFRGKLFIISKCK